MHFIRPDGRVEFESANDGNFFLAIGYAASADYARHRDAFGFAKICVAQFAAAACAGGVVTGNW